MTNDEAVKLIERLKELVQCYEECGTDELMLYESQHGNRIAKEMLERQHENARYIRLAIAALQRPATQAEEAMEAMEAMVTIVDTHNSPMRYHVEISGNIALCRTNDLALCRTRRHSLVHDMKRHLAAILAVKGVGK